MTTFLIIWNIILTVIVVFLVAAVRALLKASIKIINGIGNHGIDLD
jgi:hypothetical protein